MLDESKYENSGGKGANGADSITIGLKAQAGAGTITIGDRNAGASLGSVYVGQGDIAKPKLDTGGWATSIGYNSDATGYGSIALGSNAVAKNSYAQDSKGKSLVYQQTVVENGEQKVRLVTKPDIQRASVAIGYGASADNGNIAIGSYSDASTDLRTVKDDSAKAYLTGNTADSYVSVGKTGALRRISNVADGAADSDAATIAQLKKAVEETDASKKANIDASNIGENLKKADGKTAADSSDKKNNKDAWGNAIGTGKVEKNNGQLVTGGTVYSALENQKKDLSVHAGWGISVAKDKDGNAISLNRNLGRDAYTKDKAVLKADENKSALVIGGRVNPGDATGGQTAEKDYGALGQDSVTVGGADNTVRENGDAAVVVGGVSNTASAQYSTVIGGSANDALGNQSSVFGGHDNDAHGTYSTASGGSMNRAYGAAASVFGGGVNSALGNSSVAVGGLQSTVNGTFAVGIAGGSTNADYTLAAGNGANVTVENGTAIGYQATTDEAGTIAFGHDAGDAYYSSTTWPQKATKQNGKYYDANNKEISKAKYDALKNSDGTWNDYSKTPTVVEKTYDKAAYNRLVKVADGVDAHDVVVMEQLDKAKTELTKDLSVNAGWGINIADEKDPKTGEVTKKNTISLNRNLGTNYGNLGWGEGKVTFEASGQNSLILGGAASVSEYDHHSDVKAGVYGKDSVLVGGFNNLIGEKGETSVIVGGQENQVTNQKSVIVGGFWNKVTGSTSVVVGGVSNEASGSGDGVFGGSRNKVSGGESVVLGGETNEVIGMNSVVSGGTDNKVSGYYAIANGGKQNTISGNYAATLGGFNNQSKGMFSNAIGGDNNVTSGQYSMTSGGSGNTASGDNSYIGGGGSNQAAGVGASVFGGYRSKVNGNLSTGVGGGSTNNRATAALAAGYQSMVTDGGVAYRSLTSEERSKIYKGQQYWPGFSGILADNDTKVLDRISTAIGYQATADAPGVISFGHDKGDKSSENGSYSSAYYNRLVKAADGIDAHDAVVMEQLKPYTKSDASNIGANLETYTVGDDGETITEAKATKEQQNVNKDAWGKALGAEKFSEGTTTTATNASTSDQLVTGKTLYAYDKPTGSTNYVNANYTTGQNLSALDAQVKANADTLKDKTHNIKYYSVDESLPKINGYTNEGNDGAKGMGSLAAGFNTHADGIASTVAGSYSDVINTGDVKLMGYDFRGATALSYGTFNINQSTAQSGVFSGVANSIVGQANMTTNSNAAIIYGAGNTVTDSYRPIDPKKAGAIRDNVSDPAKLSKAMQDAVKESGGQVMVMGGGNNVESAYMSQVVGVGNTVKGNQVKDDKNEWVTDTSSETAIKDYDPEKSSQYNYVDGFSNEVINGKHDYVIGSNNTVSGDSTDKNQSNIVFGDNHKLTNQKNNVIIGSSDTADDETTASDVVAIGHNAKVSAEGGVAIGSGSEATVTGKSTEGYDPTTGKNSTKTTAAWQATKAAVSIGKADGTVTRQINGVAAGTNDTDAVNVAQIKKLASINASNIGANLQYGANGTTAATDTDKTKNKEAWATAIGTGTVTKDDDGSKQMVTGKTVYDALHGGLDNITVGKDGQNGKDGSIGIAGQNGKDGYTMTIIKTEQGAAGVDGKDGITRVVYQDKDGNGKHTFATLDDGLKFKGDDSTVIAKKLNEQLNITGGADSTKLTDKNIGVNSSTDGLKIQLAKNLAGITSIANQTTTGEGDAQTTTGAKIDLKDDGSISVNSGKITDVKSGLTATDGTYADTDKNNAANIGDVHSMIEKEAGNTDDKLALKANVAADNIGTHITDTTAQKTNLDNWGAAIGTGAVADSTNEHANQLVTGKTVYDALHGGLDNITVGKDGQNGKDGSIGIAGQNGKDGYTMTIIKTEQGAAGVDGKDGITRVVYQDKDGNGKHTFATLDDGLKFKGDDSTVIAKKLNEQLNITGGADSTKLTDKNIGVNSSTDGLKIQLAKDLTSITSISGSTDTNGAKITLDENDKNISVNGGSIKDVASNLTKDGKIIKGSANNAASISDVQTLVQQGVDNGYTHGNGITIQKDGTSGKNVISVNQGDGLKFDNGKLAVNTGDGLTVDETTKALKIKTSDSNLKVDQNGIGLNNVITIGTSGTDAHPITIDSTKGEVSGLNNTSWDSQGNYSGSTKAATESQVAAAVKDAIKQAGDNDTHVAAGSYAVNSQHQISMNLVDKNNNNKGTVTITDVAKASEMGDVSKLDKGVQNATGTTTVVDAINNVNTKIGDQKYSQSNTSGSNKYVQDADSITSAIGKLDGAIQTVSDASSAANNIQGGDNIDVTDIKDNNDKVTGHQVSLKADISLNSVTTKTTTTDTLTVNKSANIGGVTIENKTISGLDDTKIEKDSKKAVNAGTIYNELRPATDGTYIKSTNTTAQNLTSLDTQVRATHDLINSDGKTIKIGGSDAATKIDVSGKDSSGNSTTRVITGVQTDPQDAASAANVGYVNDVTAASTQQVYRDMNRAYGSLNNNINRAAAGSNALAALHPLDFDPADKASFAVGYGHYRNANAAAVGAFYQPNANTMVNMGISLGNGDPGFNAGVSFKIGKGSAYNGVSKAEMAQTIHDQATEISAIKADDAAKDKRIDALEKENQEMKKQIQEILARLNG
ncbi:YadA-like family protein [Megasphaera elsdenii]|uniref:YadA-like family protein n=1 Tax=Megasphaera elsdenii TaxID=907 RepID=UPI00242F3118|nr:YadA-like family protein [Megasphaera elsdenii]